MRIRAPLELGHTCSSICPTSLLPAACVERAANEVWLPARRVMAPGACPVNDLLSVLILARSRSASSVSLTMSVLPLASVSLGVAHPGVELGCGVREPGGCAIEKKDP